MYGWPAEMTTRISSRTNRGERTDRRGVALELDYFEATTDLLISRLIEASLWGSTGKCSTPAPAYKGVEAVWYGAAENTEWGGQKSSTHVVKHVSWMNIERYYDVKRYLRLSEGASECKEQSYIWTVVDS